MLFCLYRINHIVRETKTPADGPRTFQIASAVLVNEKRELTEVATFREVRFVPDGFYTETTCSSANTMMTRYYGNGQIHPHIRVNSLPDVPCAMCAKRFLCIR